MPEKKISNAIMKHLRKQGILCFRHEPITYNPKTGTHVTSPYSMNGVADILAVMPDGTGRFLAIEVKAKNGKQSPNQVIFEKRLQAHKGVYCLVKSIDDVNECLRTNTLQTSS